MPYNVVSVWREDLAVDLTSAITAETLTSTQDGAMGIEIGLLSSRRQTNSNVH